MSNYASVKTQHREYQAAYPKWKKVRDVLASNCKSYLRNVGASEPDEVYGAKRQKEYEDGAILYNFTKRTLSGMVGAVMRKPPEVQLPSALEYLLENCDGAGMDLIQQAQDALKEVDAVGRAGLLVDAPNTAAATKAEQNAGKLNPRIQLYTAENIVNWRKTKYGSTQVVSLVVLREPYEYANEANEFKWLCGEAYRVLELYEGVYRQRVFYFDEKGAQSKYEEIIPSINSKPLDYIPFAFIGADNNDDCIDPAPLETLAEINIGHFRNSADLEESSFICSQPTLMLYPGETLTPAVFAEANPHGIRLGSRIGHNLGAGGAAEFLQAEASNLAKELMKQKEEQAVMAGAQLITPSSQITAESARLQRGADTSIMATIAINVSQSYTQASIWCAAFLGVVGEVVFELNTDFFMLPLTAQDRAAWMADLNAGLLPNTAYYSALRKAGVTDFTDEEIQDGLDEQPPAPAPAMNANVQGEIPPAPADEAQQ